MTVRRTADEWARLVASAGVFSVCRLPGQGCLAADVGEQVIGEQLREGFGQFNVRHVAVAYGLVF